MSNKTKSLIRHALTAIGTVLLLVGLDQWVGLVEYAQESLDGIWAAAGAIGGFLMTVYGFIRNPERWEGEFPTLGQKD